MATRKKIEPIKVLPPDWAARKGTTSAGADGISTDERIIFLRDDLMQFMANQNRQLGQQVSQVIRQIGEVSNYQINARRFTVDEHVGMMRRIEELSAEITNLQKRLDRRWWKTFWAWLG